MADHPGTAPADDGDRAGRGAGVHVAVVTGYGAVAGTVGGVGVLLLLMGVSLVMDSDVRDIGTVLALGPTSVFAATLGLLFGTATGLVGGVLSLPWRRRPEVIAAHAWAWALAMGGVAIALLAMWGDGLPATSPSPNETTQHVVEDWVLGVVGPGAAAGAATWWATRSLARHALAPRQTPTHPQEAGPDPSF